MIPKPSTQRMKRWMQQNTKKGDPDPPKEEKKEIANRNVESEKTERKRKDATQTMPQMQGVEEMKVVQEVGSNKVDDLNDDNMLEDDGDLLADDMDIHSMTDEERAKMKQELGLDGMIVDVTSGSGSGSINT